MNTSNKAIRKNVKNVMRGKRQCKSLASPNCNNMELINYICF